MNPSATMNELEAVFERRMQEVMRSVDLHHAVLQDYLHRLTHQWQDAEDILQELWRYVLLHFPEDKIQTLSLLRRKAYQLFVDHYRTAKRRPEIVTDTVPEVPVSVAREQSFSAADEAALRERFWGGFPGIALSDIQKDVLWRHARYGLTYQEIEQEMGVPASTVGDWIALGRELLADHLNRNED